MSGGVRGSIICLRDKILDKYNYKNDKPSWLGISTPVSLQKESESRLLFKQLTPIQLYASMSKVYGCSHLQCAP